ncbi:iron-sulfur cluster assembly scaffold protein [Mycoplasma marinum]|uniref:Iron-sulfur cluster assembly scaffold protein n=1 Tax=Mycoplasma marinum TaxID=1937190 RepID=A0A4R0XQU5_9MOLU|nr:iron-sulfur cluster assembly scaffold protein [Mycoplasma marinum]TCG10740.1 iron-sulfur cluster assembly scaffold protein [Mycoplasma marinum]
MTSYKDPNKRREIIMDRYSNPTHKGEIKGVKPLEKFSTQCVDNTKLYLEWEGEILKDVKHTSTGCAVFLSSLDLFLDYAKGKSKKDILHLSMEYDTMINQSGEFDIELLDKLIIFDNVKSHLNRLLCANIISEAFKELLK